MFSKILIVDDSVVAQSIMKKCLPSDRDFQISVASNGREGVDIYSKEKPDLVFLDLTMPVMGGVEALEEIKKNDPEAIVVVATADVQKKVIEKVISMGALMVLKKPPSKESVLEALTMAEDSVGG